MRAPFPGEMFMSESILKGSTVHLQTVQRSGLAIAETLVEPWGTCNLQCKGTGYAGCCHRIPVRLSTVQRWSESTVHSSRLVSIGLTTRGAAHVEFEMPFPQMPPAIPISACDAIHSQDRPLVCLV